MTKILLIEDNATIVMGLEYLIQEEGYEFYHGANVEEARIRLGERAYDLILLDVSLPDGDGFALCQEIKDRDLAPVIFLTARDEETDVVTGFDLGADDYVIKPFRNRELISRIQNVLRRTGKTDKMIHGGIQLDSQAHKVYRDGTELALTKLEYKILSVLFSQPRKVFTREEILAEIWDMQGNFVNDNTLTVTIKRLREKLQDTDGQLITTVRGVGYRLGEGR